MSDTQIWLEKSTENLNAAQVCFEKGHFNACANRLYYAMFQAGAAISYKQSIYPPGKKIGHSWLQATFSRQLTQRQKIISAKFRSYLPDALRIRLAADYELFVVSKKTVEREMKKAEDFVQTIREELGYVP